MAHERDLIQQGFDFEKDRIELEAELRRSDSPAEIRTITQQLDQVRGVIAEHTVVDLGHPRTPRVGEAGIAPAPPVPDPLRQEASAAVSPHTAIAEGIAALAAELAQGKSERLTSYLTFMSRFYSYSLYNQLLIYDQLPFATHVGGYEFWKHAGFQVAKGEKAIKIFAPAFSRKRTDTNRPTRKGKAKTGAPAPPDQTAADDEEQVVRRFVLVNVFDASQLTPESQARLPQFFTPIAGDRSAFAQRIEQAIRAEGIGIQESNHTGEAQGFSAGGLITVKKGLDSTSRALTLLHEWGHEHLHYTSTDRTYSRKQKEAHAEASAFIVARHFGIAHPYAADYLHSWSVTPKDLETALVAVTKAASHMIVRLHSLNLGEQQFHDSPTAEE